VLDHPSDDGFIDLEWAWGLLRLTNATALETLMSERPKGNETDQQHAVEQARRRRLPGTPGRRNQGDAIEPSGEVNREKLRENQERLHVGSDHRTDAMKKGKRGTYP
jgi:hypothetical protein